MTDEEWRGYVTAKLEEMVASMADMKRTICTFQDKLFSLRLKFAVMSGTISLVVTILVLLLTKYVGR
jgi:hypothetical protein